MVDVSVLIPARNVALTVEKAIRSALDQSGVNLEVIVCPNGSTDETVAVVNVINDPRIVVAHTDAEGVGTALNACAAVAQGEYFIELDGDDYFHPGCLNKLASALDGTPSCVGYSHGCIQYHGDADVLYKPRPFNRNDYWRGNACLYPFMYKRAAWDAGCRYHDHIYVEGRWISVQDWDMALQLVWHMRYEAIPLPDTLVLHYNFKRSAEGQSLGQKYNAELIAAFKQRWPAVQVERIG